MNDALLDALDGLVPEPTADGDWGAVLARAGVRPARRRRLVVAALVAAAVAIALVAPRPSGSEERSST
jgi:hypothetical protein